MDDEQTPPAPGAEIIVPPAASAITNGPTDLSTQFASGIPFVQSLASSVFALDPCWNIEPTRAMGALLMLMRTDASAHMAAYQQRSESLTLTAVMAAVASGKTGPDLEAIIEACANSASVQAARNIADTNGVDRLAYGQNSDGSRKPYPIDGGVARLAITGPMTKEAAPSMSEGTSTVMARRIVRMARTDGDVKAVLIRFDSPGGQVRGNDDLARDVAALAAEKPTYGYCEDCCASACYYVASQCNAIYANPSAVIGSNATVMTFMDFSKMLASLGVNVDVIVPPDAPYKGAGTPGTPLSDDQRAYFQGLINTYAAQFRSAIQKGRRLTNEQMAKVIDGRVFPAAQARDLGLIDGVTSYDRVLEQLKRYRPAKSGS